MATQITTFEVPAKLTDEVIVASEVLREMLSKQLGHDVDVRVIRPRVDGLAVGEVAIALLAIPTSALAILSKKWLEEVVWPEVKKRVHKPTQEGLDYLFTLLPTRDSSGTK